MKISCPPWLKEIRFGIRHPIKLTPSGELALEDWQEQGLIELNPGGSISFGLDLVFYLVDRLLISSGEMRDLAENELGVLHLIYSPTTKDVLVSSETYLGHENFYFLVSVSHSKPTKLSKNNLGEWAVLLETLGPLQMAVCALTAEFNELSEKTEGIQYTYLKFIQSISEKANEVFPSYGSDKVTLHEHLKKIRIVEVEKINLELKKETPRVASLKPNAIDDQGRAVPVLAHQISKDGRIQKWDSKSAGGQKEVMIFSLDQADALRSIQKEGKITPKRQAEIKKEPNRIFNEGIDLSSINLADFSERVAGFEEIPALKLTSLTSSGSDLKWIEAVDEKLPLFQVIAESLEGQPITISLDDENHVEDFIDKVSAAIEKNQEKVTWALPKSDFKDEPSEVEVKLNPNLVSQVKDHVDRFHQKDQSAVKKKRLICIPKLKDVHLEVEGEKKWGEDFKLQPESYLCPEISLKPHQEEGVKWLYGRALNGTAGSLLADDMGLGKTLQVISFLCEMELRGMLLAGQPVLILAPLILVRNWIDEIDKFVKNHFWKQAPLELHGPNLKRFYDKNKRIDVEQLSYFKLVITTYDTFARHSHQLLKVNWSVTVVDEAQEIKNPDSLVSRCVRGLKSNYKIALTGTPVENNLQDIWTISDYFMHLLLGTQSDFQRLSRDVEKGLSFVKQNMYHKAEGYAQILRREKKNTLEGLPEKKEHYPNEPMTQAQWEKEQKLAQISKQKKISLLELLPQLAVLYQHPDLNCWREFDLVTLISSSPKLKTCLKILEAINEKSEKAIIFAVRIEVMDLLAHVVKSYFGLKDCHLINGESNARGVSHARIQSFSNSPGFQVMVLNTIAAGAGLNITAANHVIHFGRWWNPAKEDQASDRAYRIGQTREVHVYYPIIHKPHFPDQGFDVKLHEIAMKKRKLRSDFLMPMEAEVTDDEFADLAGFCAAS
jgi:SNF2 family DNA or RNA helicase